MTISQIKNDLNKIIISTYEIDNNNYTIKNKTKFNKCR